MLYFGEIISRIGIQAGQRKLHVLIEIPSPNNKEELQSFLGIMNYLG